MFLFNYDIFYTVLTYFIIFGGIVVFIFILVRNIICWYFKVNEVKNLQEKILERLDFIENLLKESAKSKNKFNAISSHKNESKNLEHEIKEHLTEDELIKEIFKTSKNIIVYDLNEDEKNVFTYFKAKQYNVMLINRKIEDFKNYATIMSVEDIIDVLVIKTKTDKLKDILKECVARRKIKNDIKYIWIEQNIGDDKILEEFDKENIQIIFGKNFYKEYVRLMLKK